jgi:hypothetical protein
MTFDEPIADFALPRISVKLKSKIPPKAGLDTPDELCFIEGGEELTGTVLS